MAESSDWVATAGAEVSAAANEVEAASELEPELEPEPDSESEPEPEPEPEPESDPPVAEAMAESALLVADICADPAPDEAPVVSAAPDEAAPLEASADELSADELAAEVDEASLDDCDALAWPWHESSNADCAVSALSLGQLFFKHFLTSSLFDEQMHDKSFNPLQLDPFSTWATQANKHAGGVATALSKSPAKATNVVI